MTRLKQLATAAIILATAHTVRAQVTVSTGNYNNSRTNANVSETILNPTNVNTATFGKLFTWTVDQAVFAQPLYVPNVNIPNAGTHNVVYVATMNNSIYAFDATTLSATPLWTQNYGPRVPVSAAGASNTGCPTYGTGDLGILSTPVIDPSSGTLYFVTTTPGTPGQGGGYVFYMNAVDMATGLPKFGSPIQIVGRSVGKGYGTQTVNGYPDKQNGLVILNNFTHAQRPALALANGAVYAAFANCGPDVDPWHGWVIGYANKTLKLISLFNTTPNGSAGGVWQSGRGLVIDSRGNLYFATGNGADGTGLYGSSIMKLSLFGLVTDHYTPSSASFLNQYDLDVSSAGPVEIPKSGYIVAGGKQGIIYLLSENGLSTPVQSFQATSCSISQYTGCNEIHAFAYWPTSSTTGLLNVWAGNDYLRVFSYANGLFNTNPTIGLQLTDGSGPGMAVSSNGTNTSTGILWITTGADYPYYTPAIPPIVIAQSATNPTQVLWTSSQNSARDAVSSITKWATPTVANGRVFVAGRNGQVYVFGLLGQ